MSFRRHPESPKSVLVDMDEITCHLTAKALRVYNKQHGTTLSQADITTWDSPFVECSLGLEGFFDDLEPIPGALEGIARLHDGGFDVRFLTAPFNPASARSKYEWVQRHLPWCNLRNVIMTHDKWRVHGDYLIDDKPATLVRWSQCWPEGQAIGISYPYNQGLPEPIRCFDDFAHTERAWKDITDFIMETEHAR